MKTVAGTFHVPSARSRSWRARQVSSHGTRRVPATMRGIDLLQERRTALISAAVPGRIDVRSAAQTMVAL